MSTPRTRVSLDGAWSMAYDATDVGIDDRWFESAPEDQQEVELPSMQSQGLFGHGGVGWYFREFNYDDAWQGRHTSLRIGSTGYPLTVWLNGTRLGEHVGGSVPGEFPISAQLRPDSNVLAIRLAMSDLHDEHTGEPSAAYPRDSLADVSLCTTVKTQIEGVSIQPDIRRKRVKVSVEAPASSTVHLGIEGTASHAEGKPGELTLDFTEFTCWSPETPELYTLRIDLVGEDGESDSLSCSFGMREFTVKDERFYLNNRPHYLKSVSYLPHYPTNLKAGKLEALLRREMKLVKGGGANAIRICGGPAPEALLDIADSLGILVFAEAPRLDSFRDMTEWVEGVQSLVLRDRNHASLVAWCGLESLLGDPQKVGHEPPSVIAELRTLDPGRLILCDGGKVSTLLRPYRDVGEVFQSFEAPFVPPVGQLAKDYLRLCGEPSELNWQRRLGAGGFTGWADGSSAGAASQSEFESVFSQRKLERCFGNLDAFMAASQELQSSALRVQLDAVRSNVKVSGYEIDGLCDGPAVTPFGLADVRRQAKPIHKLLNSMQRETRPVVQIYRTNLVPREEVGVTILLINEARLEGRGELSLQVVGPTNQVLWKKSRQVKIPRHGRELWSGEIAASGSPGPHKFVVRLMQDRRIIGENSVDLHVVQPQKAEPVEVNVLGGKTAWQTTCGKLAKLGNFLAPIHIVPPIANSIRAYPASDLVQALAQVYEGAVAIIFGPPEDWNEFSEHIGSDLQVDCCAIVAGQRLNHHYAKMHPIFEGLPSRCLMGQPYQNVLATQAFSSDTDEEMSGVHSSSRALGGDNGAVQHFWGSNITVRRLGAGRVVFTHLRILEHLGTDPVADRLFVNLLHHFSRRSIPATEVVEADQRTAEWLRQGRASFVRKWMVIGAFPNWGDCTGHDAAYPPESELNFDATYPGWYRAARWKGWHTRADDGHKLDFTEALDSDVGTASPCPRGTGYAYAEFSCDRRQEVAINLEGGPKKVWLNGAIAHVSDLDEESVERCETTVAWVKQGKNTLLVKCSNVSGPFALKLAIEPTDSAPLNINWWK
jgi:beta-galactosidase